MLPQVLELTAVQPSPPRNLQVQNKNLTFLCPEYVGGTRLQGYEVHIQPDQSDEWYLFLRIPVNSLSSDPDIPENLFGCISGTFQVRVCAETLAGVGMGEEVVATFEGEQKFESFRYCALGQNHFSRRSVTFWEEHIVLFDHGDMPKTWQSVRASTKLCLKNIEVNHNRKVERIFFVTDTGGENWGTVPLSQYSWGNADYEAEVVWCPTPAQHSGQPSDSCGGTFKRWIKLEAMAGNLRGVTKAAQLVQFCQNQPMFREINHKKYLNATTTRRTFTHLTKQDVETSMPKQLAASRSVQTLPGVSKFKQAFSLSEGFTLLARERGC